MGKAFWFALLLSLQACGGSLDAGQDKPQGMLPVDGRNPTILIGDGFIDNWQGEYALLYAATGQLSLVGIVVDTGPTWKNLTDLLTGWRAMVSAAQQAGMKNITYPIGSTAAKLVEPSDRQIDSTDFDRSEGAQLIVRLSLELATPHRPLVVVTGAHLTDVAAAYLMDHSVVDRVVVLSALGSVTATGGLMGVANGEMDPWADVIVASKFRYIQASTYYDPLSDLPANVLPQLPVNPFTDWVKDKQPKVWNDLDAADQNAVNALVLPRFVSSFERVSFQMPTSTGGLPTLNKDDNGPIQLITQVSGAIATSTFWQMLMDPATYGAN